MFERSEFMNFSFENKINKIIFHQQGSFLFVDAGDERPLGSSMTSRADELKILFIKFLICSLIKNIFGKIFKFSLIRLDVIFQYLVSFLFC